MYLLDYLRDHSKRKGDHVGWVVEGIPYTYRQMDVNTNKFANSLLASGLKKGDRVSTYLPNSLEYLITCYGVAKAGGVVNPLNTMFKGAEIKYIVNDAGSKVLVTTPELVGTVLEIKRELPLIEKVILTGDEFNKLLKDFSDAPPKVAIEGGDNMFLAYSSGTTGNPKGVVHTHRSTTGQAVGSAIRIGLNREDKIVSALPLFHLYGGNIILGGAIVAGSCLIVHARFDAERILSSVAEFGANLISGVPTMFAYLNDLPLSTISKYKLTSLLSGVSAGSILSPKIYNEFKDIYGARIADLYGITEAAGNLAGNYRYGMVKPASAGPAYPLTDIKIVDENDNPLPVGEVGELIARGPQIMKEYWRMPEETEKTLKGGYLHTGDLARMDEDGFVYIVDRKKDMIITGGFNIYPAEVEILMNTYYKVSQSAMFGVKDEAKGEIGWAAIVLKEGMTATEEEIVEYCRSQMAVYKCPRKVVFRESLPVNVMNKVLRRKLRDEYSAAGASTTAKK